MSSPASYRHVLLLVAATACWGTGTVVTKGVLNDVKPLPLLTIQLLASCVFLFLISLVPLARRRRGQFAGITQSRPKWRLTALGVLNPGLAYALGLLGLSTMQLAALLFAALLAVSTRVLLGQDWSMGSVTSTTWLTAAASGILYYGLAFWLFLAALRRIPATVVGAFIPLTPVFGVTAAYLVGERLDAHQWFGAALVIGATGGVAIHQIRSGNDNSVGTPSDPRTAAPQDSPSATPPGDECADFSNTRDG